MITADKLKNLSIIHTDDYKEAQNLIEEFKSKKKIRIPFYLNADEFDRILRWKLDNQYGRSEKYRSNYTDKIIQQITRLALNIKHKDKDYEMELRVNLLCSLKGVAVPVASAILALVYPDDYGVIDFRAFRQVFGEVKEIICVNDFTVYPKL
jgi:hypothetical protein